MKKIQFPKIEYSIEKKFPIYLILLILLPIFIAYIINFEAGNQFSIIVNYVWLPIALLPFYLFKIRLFYTFVVIFYFFVGFIEITHWILLKGPLTITSLLVMSNTQAEEALDFFNLKSNIGLLLLIPYCVLFLLALKRPPKVSNSKFKIFYIIVPLMLIVGLYISVPKRIFLTYGVPQITRVSYAFAFEYSTYKRAIENNYLKKVKATQTTNYNEQLFVLIIGESGSRNHMSLYNYEIKTNPKLEKRNDLIIFTDVVSPYSNTIPCVMSMISQSNLENQLTFDKSKDLMDVFSSIGFKTYWISNQPPFGLAENLISAIGSKSNYSKFVNVTSNFSYEGDVKSSYDEKLFKPFSYALNDDASKKFIVLHLMGSHATYTKRYPPEFDYLKGANAKDQMIAEYDNSVIYNDFVIDSLFSLIEQKSLTNSELITSAIYLSDHGENVYDEIGNIGHDYVNKLPKSNVEVPFMIWLSPSFIELNPSKVATIQSNIDKPFVSDDLFHVILDLNHIKSPLLKESRSIFNENFNDKRIRILEDNIDYDKKKKNPDI